MNKRPAGSSNSSGWLWALVAAAVLAQTALNLARPLISYKILALGGDAAAIGLVTALFSFLPMIAALWLGRLSDRLGSLRGLVIAGVVLFSAAAGALALMPSIAWLALASAALGLGQLVFTIAGQSTIARHSTASQLDSGFGWYTAAFSFGQLLGPLLAGLLLGGQLDSTPSSRLADINAALFLAAGIAVLAVPVMALRAAGGPRKASKRSAAKPVPAESAGSILARPGVKSNMVASIALLCTADILVAFLPLIGEERNVAPLWVGILLAIRASASILSRLLLSRFLVTWSRSQLVTSSLAGSGIALTITPFFMDNFWVAGITLFVGGFFLGLGQPLTMSLITQAVSPQSRGAALAVRMLGNRVGQVVLPLAAGLVAAPLGPSGAIWFSCLVLGATASAKGLAADKHDGGEAA